MQKIIVILGPTASGKTGLSISLAKKFKAEIISADSRQIYKNLRIGSAVITPKEKQGIKHHLIEFLKPEKSFSAGTFQKMAEQKIAEIAKRGRLPMIVGGTGFYIQTITDNLNLPRIKPNQKLRQNLEKKTTNQLFLILKKLSPQKASLIDRQNPRRLIRAIEIAKNKSIINPQKSPVKYELLILGINQPWLKLKHRIEKRFYAQLENGFLREVKKLFRQKLKKKRFQELGLQYWLAWQYFKKKISYDEFCQKCLFSLYHYAKRQKTWFKRDPRIIWIKNQAQAKKLIKKFLKS